MMAETELARLHATVSGRVQGVSFRYFVVDQAEALGLTGWVRNHWSGIVEVTAEGRRSQLDTLLEALREGPPMASVDDVCSEWLTYSAEFSGFHIIATV